jgi:diguanylate cyclase (GGDEF)-like protein
MKQPPHSARLRRLIIFASGLIIALVVGWIDYITGLYLVLSLFYLFPIAAISWFSGRTYGLIAAVFSAVVLLASDLIWYAPSRHSIVPYWNSFVGCMIFVIVVLGLTRIKHDMAIIRGIAEKEKTLARTDSLTGIANVRAFYEALNSETEKARRYDHPVTIVCMDIDDFKKINDSYGHLAGDEVLKEIADMIRRIIRNVDTEARLGGDEFAILLPETTAEEARSMIERIHLVVKEELRKKNWQVTISAGIASFVKILPSADAMISRADGLMYAAKISGKDRIEARAFDA